MLLKYEDDFGYTSYYKALNEKFNRIKVLSIGQVAPEIILNDPEENQLTLSSFRGKYVLLDFWAAWCKPCRVENPNIVKMYNKYKKYGFEVYQVSLDRDKSTWLNAINMDGLQELNHVSDLKFWKSDAAVTYNIKSIPASFFNLVDLLFSTTSIKSLCKSNCIFFNLSISSCFSSINGSNVLLFFPAV